MIDKKEELVGTRAHVIAAIPLFVAEGQTTALDGTATFAIEFPKYARILEIVVEQESGTGVTFSFAVLDRKGAYSTFKRVMDLQAPAASLHLYSQWFAFVNQDDAKEEKAYLYILPNAGADNIYNYKIVAEVAI